MTKRPDTLFTASKKKLSNDATGDFEALSLEHVLPKNFDKKWEKSFDDTDKMDSFVNRIGNMTLLPRSVNSQLGKKTFKDKKSVFQKSELKTTQKCAEYDQWDEESILGRQKWLGQNACSLWSIPGL